MRFTWIDLVERICIVNMICSVNLCLQLDKCFSNLIEERILQKVNIKAENAIPEEQGANFQSKCS